MMDLLIRCNTAYKNRKSQWVTAHVKILRRIPLASVLASLPIDWYQTAPICYGAATGSPVLTDGAHCAATRCGYAIGAGNEVACWLRVPKMLLILACYKTMARTPHKSAGRRHQLVPLLKIVALTLHWCACGWFYLGRASGDWFKPVVSWYQVDEVCPSRPHLPCIVASDLPWIAPLGQSPTCLG